MAIGLDQIPESLLPLLASRIAAAAQLARYPRRVAIFFVGEIVLSRLLFKLHLRDRPY